MKIGEVAQQAGVGVETIRFYEQKGLIHQPLKPQTGGFRSYSVNAVRRIQFIRSAQLLGFSLSEISELLKLEAGDDAKCVHVRERAEQKRKEVQSKISNLRKIEAALDDLINACPGEGPAIQCSILEAINNGWLHLDPLTNGEHNGQQDS